MPSGWVVALDQAKWSGHWNRARMSRIPTTGSVHLRLIVDGKCNRDNGEQRGDKCVCWLIELAWHNNGRPLLLVLLGTTIVPFTSGFLITFVVQRTS